MTDERRVGVALSGGGHRATVFGIGAVLALIDSGLQDDIVSVSSVSGGSIANGILLTGPDLATTTRDEFIAHVRQPLASIATRGILLGGAPRTRLYMIALKVVGVIAALGLVVSIILALADSRPGLRHILLGVAVLGLAAAWLLLGQRGRRTGAAIDHEALGGSHVMLGATDAPGGRRRQAHHVICTTELQTGNACYFSPRAVYNFQFGPGASGKVRLSDAVRASAGVPGAFDPTMVQLADLGITALPARPGRPAAPLPTPHLVLNDGGTYDNMADQWEYGIDSRREMWPELASIQPHSANFLVIVNASKGWDDIQPIKRGRFAREKNGLTRSQAVQYDVSTSHRRQALYDRFTADETIESMGGKPGVDGVFAQISRSPYGAANALLGQAAELPGSVPEDRLARAQQAIAHLDEHYAGHNWKKQATDNAKVKTTLAKLGPACVASLLEHAYVLLRVNLYVVHGLGHLPEPGAVDFAAICSEGTV